MDVSDSPTIEVTVARPFRIHTGFRPMSGISMAVPIGKAACGL